MGSGPGRRLGEFPEPARGDTHDANVASHPGEQQGALQRAEDQSGKLVRLARRDALTVEVTHEPGQPRVVNDPAGVAYRLALVRGVKRHGGDGTPVLEIRPLQVGGEQVAQRSQGGRDAVGLPDGGRHAHPEFRAGRRDRLSRQLLLAAGEMEVHNPLGGAALGDHLAEPGRPVPLPPKEFPGGAQQPLPRLASCGHAYNYY